MDLKEIIITIMVTLVSSTAFWSFISKRIDKKEAEKSAERRALLGLLHDRIYTLGNYYIDQGHISTADYDNFNYLYEPYNALKGNGTGKRIKVAVDNLPIINE